MRILYIHTYVTGIHTYWLQAEEDSEQWRNYIQHLDEIVLDGFFSCILCSLQYLMTNTDKDKADLPGPLLECKLELQTPEMVFLPTLEQVWLCNIMNNMCTVYIGKLWSMYMCLQLQ